MVTRHWNNISYPVISQFVSGIETLYPILCRCCASCCRPSSKDFLLIADNCCECNIEATKLFLKDREHEIVYVSYKDEVFRMSVFC